MSLFSVPETDRFSSTQRQQSQKKYTNNPNFPNDPKVSPSTPPHPNTADSPRKSKSAQEPLQQVTSSSSVTSPESEDDRSVHSQRSIYSDQEHSPTPSSSSSARPTISPPSNATSHRKPPTIPRSFSPSSISKGAPILSIAETSLQYTNDNNHTNHVDNIKQITIETAQRTDTHSESNIRPSVDIINNPNKASINVEVEDQVSLAISAIEQRDSDSDHDTVNSFLLLRHASQHTAAIPENDDIHTNTDKYSNNPPQRSAFDPMDSFLSTNRSRSLSFDTLLNAKKPSDDNGEVAMDLFLLASQNLEDILDMAPTEEEEEEFRRQDEIISSLKSSIFPKTPMTKPPFSPF